ncbi:MAG: hypothetical protein Q9M21_07110 [Mariprofundaceae bacterium]|nr:hypothetical protein [Mariprofundaceae bacterium]
MMAQGATLKLQGDKHGDVMLSQSADLLRRAMSGPEMAAMHKGGQGQSAMMHHTHDLGAAAFDLLDLMMSLQETPVQEDDYRLHYALNMAAQGASLKSLAIMGMAGDIDQAMQQHGQTMQEGAMHLIKETSADTAYKKAVLKVIHLLANETSESMQHSH